MEEMRNLKFKMMNLDNKHLKKNPFTVPENYFNDFSNKIMNKIENEELELSSKKGRKTIWLKPMIAAAASLIILFSLSTLIWEQPDNYNLQDKELAAENSLEDYLLMVDDYYIFEAIENNSEGEIEEDLNITTMEEVLIASVSEYELLMN